MVKVESIPLVEKVGRTEREVVVAVWKRICIYRARKYTRKHYARKDPLHPRYTRGDHENARTAYPDPHYFWWAHVRSNRHPQADWYHKLMKNAASRFIVLKNGKAKKWQLGR